MDLYYKVEKRKTTNVYSTCKIRKINDILCDIITAIVITSLRKRKFHHSPNKQYVECVVYRTFRLILVKFLCISMFQAKKAFFVSAIQRSKILLEPRKHTRSNLRSNFFFSFSVCLFVCFFFLCCSYSKC